MPSGNPTFVERNFTEAEIKYYRSQPSPPASFAARWVGKEAFFKSLRVASKGAAAALKILPNEEGAPTATLHGDAKAAVESKGVSNVLLSLSHSDVSTLLILSTQYIVSSDFVLPQTIAIAFAQASSSWTLWFYLFFSLMSLSRRILSHGPARRLSVSCFSRCFEVSFILLISIISSALSLPS